jgi:hypothetical protein
MNRVIVPARQATQPGGISSLESILGLLKSLKIRALVYLYQRQFFPRAFNLFLKNFIYNLVLIGFKWLGYIHVLFAPILKVLTNEK